MISAYVLIEMFQLFVEEIHLRGLSPPPVTFHLDGAKPEYLVSVSELNVARLWFVSGRLEAQSYVVVWRRLHQSYR